MPKKRSKKKGKKKRAKIKTRTMHAKAAREELKRNPKSQKKNPLRLTAQQTLFVDYLIGTARMNGTKAAIMAGYSRHSAARIASSLLHNHLVTAYLHRRQDDLKRRLEVTQDKIVAEMAALAFAKPSEFVSLRNGILTVKDLDDIPECIQGAIKSFKPIFGKKGRSLGLEIRFYDKVAAAKLLAQHLGMLDVKASVDHRGELLKVFDEMREKAKALPEEDQ